MVYQIRIEGHLARGWTDWFGGLTITLEEDGDTLLTGVVSPGPPSLELHRFASHLSPHG